MHLGRDRRASFCTCLNGVHGSSIVYDHNLGQKTIRSVRKSERRRVLVKPLQKGGRHLVELRNLLDARLKCYKWTHFIEALPVELRGWRNQWHEGVTFSAGHDQWRGTCKNVCCCYFFCPF